MNKIVISNWLKKIVNGLGQKCDLVPNGFDTQEYYLTIPIPQKQKYTISMLYHEFVEKGCDIAMDALNIVKQKYPNLHVNMFGTPSRPKNLPSWYDYYQSPSKEEHLRINNESAIYVAASRIEGWGLTIGEAMLCGQAVVCTDVNGFREMAVDGRNAYLSPIDDINKMADNICKLIADDEERIRIADNGLKDIKAFSLDKSCKKFQKALGL